MSNMFYQDEPGQAEARRLLQFEVSDYQSAGEGLKTSFTTKFFAIIDGSSEDVKFDWNMIIISIVCNFTSFLAIAYTVYNLIAAYTSAYTKS